MARICLEWVDVNGETGPGQATETRCRIPISRLGDVRHAHEAKQSWLTTHGHLIEMLVLLPVVTEEIRDTNGSQPGPVALQEKFRLLEREAWRRRLLFSI